MVLLIVAPVEPGEGMVVEAPQPARGTDTPRDYREIEALREQALIEEARRRARRRRRRYMALVLSGLSVAAALGFVRAAGEEVEAGAGAPPSPPLLVGADTWNGQIAIADGSG